MRTLSTLVYIPVLFTLVIACAPKHRGVTVDFTPPDFSKIKPTIPPAPKPAPPIAAPAPSNPSPEKQIAAYAASIVRAKSTLQLKFALPFDKETGLVETGIRPWVYTPEQKVEIAGLIKQIVTEATALLELEDNATAAATKTRGTNLLKYFDGSVNGGE